MAAQFGQFQIPTIPIDTRPKWQRELEAIQKTAPTSYAPAQGAIASVASGGYTPVSPYTPITNSSSRAIPTAATNLPAKGYETASTQDSPYAFGPNPQIPQVPVSGDSFSYSRQTTGMTPAAPFVPNWANPPTPGSAAEAAASAGLWQETEQERQERLLRESITAENKRQFEQKISPEEEYQLALNRMQNQVNMLNSVYNDMLVSSRTQNQPRYEARTQQSRIGQVLSGTVASPMGEAQTYNIQEANAQEQAAAEAVINEQRRAAIADVYKQIYASAESELKAKRDAKAKGADELVKYLNEAPGRRRERSATAIAALLAKGVDPDQMTEEEINSYTTGLGISRNDFLGQFKELKATYASEKAKTALGTRKTESEIAENLAQAKKLESDVANWGKMTDYQKQQITIENYKARNPSGKDTEKKANAMGMIASELTPGTTLPDGTPVLDKNNYITPEAYNYMVTNAPQLGLEKKDILEQFGHFLYRDEKTKYSSYGLTGADEKVLTAVAPE